MVEVYGRAVVCEALLPVGRDLAGLLGDGVDVVGQRQRDDIGFESVDYRTCLLAGAAVRLLDGDVFAGLALPVLGELGVEFLIELARRIVGHVEQGGLRQRAANEAGGQGWGQDKREQAAADGAEVHVFLRQG